MVIGSVAGAFLLPCSSISGPAAVLLKLIMQGFQANSEYLSRSGLIIICRFEGLQDQQLLGFLNRCSHAQAHCVRIFSRSTNRGLAEIRRQRSEEHTSELQSQSN